LVKHEHRDREVRWLISIADQSDIAVDTISLAVAIFDRVLNVSRVQNKYANCMALSSLSLACKLCEEDTDQSIVSRLRHLAYSAQELRRMELAILRRLDWDLALPSLVRFLQAMLSLCGPLVEGLNAQLVRQAVLQVLCCSALTSRFLASLLALALLSLLLEAAKCDWLSVVFGLQLMFQIDNAELIECREEIHGQLQTGQKENTQPFQSQWKNCNNNKKNHKKAIKKLRSVHRAAPSIHQADQQNAKLNTISEGLEWSDALLELYKVAQPD